MNLCEENATCILVQFRKDQQGEFALKKKNSELKIKRTISYI